MKKPFHMSSLILCVLAFFCMAADQPSIPVKVSPIKIARKLQKEGKYLEAQKIYERVLERPSLSKEIHEKVQTEYESLNMKMLFSRIESPGSVFYTVAAGDSLYKLAQKNKTTIDLIKKSNGLKKDVIQAGTKLKIVTGLFSIRVNKAENILTLFLDDKPVKHYQVATGLDNGTPTGEFKIMNRIENPTWFKAGSVVPSGSPENFLGTRWMGFDYPGYGIHGTIEPKSIGQHVTSGCVRMRNEEVEELYIMIPIGTKVTIVD